jgi:hypothetical protein
MRSLESALQFLSPHWESDTNGQNFSRASYLDEEEAV